MAIALVQRNYLDYFPKMLPQKAFRSFFFSSGITLLFTFQYPIALVCGAIAALATIVEAIVRPIFLKFFPGMFYLQTRVLSAVTSLVILSLLNPFGLITNPTLQRVESIFENALKLILAISTNLQSDLQETALTFII